MLVYALALACSVLQVSADANYGHGNNTYANADVACYFHMDKCLLNPPWVGTGMQVPETFSKCTLLADPTKGMALGWDCASDVAEDKAALGCSDRLIQWQMSEQMRHRVLVCMPANVTEAAAQQYWDAFDANQACIVNPERSAFECAGTGTTAAVVQLQLMGRPSSPATQNMLSVVAQACAVATAEEACATAGRTLASANSLQAEATAQLGSSSPSDAMARAASGALAVVALVSALL